MVSITDLGFCVVAALSRYINGLLRTRISNIGNCARMLSSPSSLPMLPPASEVVAVFSHSHYFSFLLIKNHNYSHSGIRLQMFRLPKRGTLLILVLRIHESADSVLYWMKYLVLGNNKLTRVRGVLR